jgi:hypothetical protein
MARLNPKLLESLVQQLTQSSSSVPVQRLTLSGRLLYDFRRSEHHRIRLLPSDIPGEPLGLPVFQHGALPGDRTLTCTATWPRLQLPCALCNVLRPPGRGTVRPGSPYYWVRVFANAVDRNDEEGGVQIAPLPLSVDEAISHATRHAFRDITDPMSGCDVLVENPRSRRRRYKTYLAQSSPLHNDPDVVARWMHQRHDIEALFPAPGPEVLAEIAHVANLLRTRIGH